MKDITKKKTGSVFVDNRCLTVEPVTQPLSDQRLC